MPRFFFDTTDNGRVVGDAVGIELAGLEAARSEASRALAEWSMDVIPDAPRRELVIEVFDESRRKLLRASLLYVMETFGG